MIGKRRVVFFAVLSILTFMISISIIVKILDDRSDVLLTVKVTDVDLELIDDGTYTGRYTVFPYAAELDVTVLNHEITNILVKIHESRDGNKAEAVFGDVIENQTLQVDVVTGSTYSSKLLLKAIEDALLNGVNASSSD